MYFIDPGIDALFQAADAVVFDLSGLLIDDEPIQLQATNDGLAPHKVRISEGEWIEICVGHKPSEYLPSMVRGSTSADIARLIQCKDAIYEKLIWGKAIDFARPGALSFLRYTRASKKGLALATSTTRTGATIVLGENGLNIRNSFDFVITGDEVKRAKPNPEIYNKVRLHLGNDLNYLVFENSPSGVSLPKALGCRASPYQIASPLAETSKGRPGHNQPRSRRITSQIAERSASVDRMSKAGSGFPSCGYPACRFAHAGYRNTKTPANGGLRRFRNLETLSNYSP